MRRNGGDCGLWKSDQRLKSLGEYPPYHWLLTKAKSPDFSAVAQNSGCHSYGNVWKSCMETGDVKSPCASVVPCTGCVPASACSVIVAPFTGRPVSMSVAQTSTLSPEYLSVSAVFVTAKYCCTTIGLPSAPTYSGESSKSA